MVTILNQTQTIISQYIAGLLVAHPHLAQLKDLPIIYHRHLDEELIPILSGGGSGHEPAHAGFVGKGMLDAAICGDIYASPSIMQIYNGILDTESNKGTLLIVKNYSGDCMNFDAASEMAIEDDDIQVEKVYVNDDIAVEDNARNAGRRGVAGTIFVHKIAGASAERGDDLKTVKAMAEKTI